MILPQPQTGQNDSQERIPECLVQFNFNCPRGSDFLLFPRAALRRLTDTGVSDISQEATALFQGYAYSFCTLFARAWAFSHVTSGMCWGLGA